MPGFLESCPVFRWTESQIPKKLIRAIMYRVLAVGQAFTFTTPGGLY